MLECPTNKSQHYPTLGTHTDEFGGPTRAFAQLADMGLSPGPRGLSGWLPVEKEKLQSGKGNLCMAGQSESRNIGGVWIRM